MDAHHDNLFCSVFGELEHAASLLQSFLPPEIADAIDWSTLQLADGALRPPRRRPGRTDLLFTATMRGRPLLIHVIIEHKSASDRWTPLQALRYVTAVLERWHHEHPDDPLPLVLPIVVHHGKAAWRGPRNTLDLFALDRLPPEQRAAWTELLPRLGYLLIDLPTMSIDQLRALAMPPTAMLTLVFLQHVRGASEAAALAAIAANLDALLAVLASPTGRERAESLFSYAFETSDLDHDQLLDLLNTRAAPAKDTAMTTADRIREEERKKFTTTAERIREEERQKFTTTAERIREEERQKLATTADRIREEEREKLTTSAERIREEERKKFTTTAERIREEERHAAATTMLMRQLTAKFGELPAAARERIAAASLEQIDGWAIRLLTAPSLADLFAAE